MPSRRQRTSAMTAIAQMACLGVPGESVVDDLLLVLRDAVGFDVSSYAVLDHNAHLRDFHVSSSVPQQVASTYVRQWYRQRENEHYASAVRPAMSQGHYDCIRMSDVMPRLRHTAYFDELMRPAGLAHGARAMLRDGDVALGMMSLARSQGHRDFTVNDMALLREAIPHLSHAMARKEIAAMEPVTDEATESALVLVDKMGRIQQASGAAWQLLARAAGRAHVPGNLTLGWAQPWLAALVVRMEALLLGQARLPPVLVERNRYGTFHLRGYVLEAGGGAMAGLYGVQIERRVPLAQRLFTSPIFRDLTARERDVCLHLVQGTPVADIAKAMDVKVSTVVTHTRNIYHRLAIHSRTQLAAALLGQVG